MTMSEQSSVREAVGVFENPYEMDAAIAELENTAFPRDAISILGNRYELEKEFGQPVVDPAAVEDDPDTPRAVPVHPEEKTIAVAAMVAVAVYTVTTVAVVLFGQAATAVDLVSSVLCGLLAGGCVGIMVYQYIRRLHGQRAEQIGAGGVVLWVRTPNPELEDVARAILTRHGARDVHIHALH